MNIQNVDIIKHTFFGKFYQVTDTDGVEHSIPDDPKNRYYKAVQDHLNA